jgi:hypothetical protein
MITTLSAFLNPTPIEETRDVIISDRFKDKDGNSVPFTIRSISQSLNEALVKSCTRQVKSSNGQYAEKFDRVAYGNALTVACTVSPDFAAPDLCQRYQVGEPSLVPARMLRAGEALKLSQAIMDINGFGDDDEELVTRVGE